MNAETWLNLSKYAQYVGSVLALIGSIGVFLISPSVDRTKNQKIEKLLEGDRKRQQENEELFGKVARYQSDLESKQREIEELKTDAIKSRRGIVSTWEFHGVRRVGTAGSMTAIAGDEVGVFQELTRLEREGKHAELIELATKQIRTTPDWLTPYLARGIAYAHIGDVQRAVVDLEHVVKSAAGDPAYDQAVPLLQRLRNRSK